MTNHKVLIIEDDLNSIKLLEDFLGVKGFKTAHAKDGITAVEEAAKDRYDVVLMDLRLPGQNGFVTVERIRQIEDYEETPIIVITAFSDEQNKLRAYKAGANFILNKPINLKELYYIIINLIKKRE